MMLSALLQFKTYQQRRDAPSLQAVAKVIRTDGCVAETRFMIGCNRLVFSLLCNIRVIMSWTPTPRVPVIMSICRHYIVSICVSADAFVLCRIRPDQTRSDQIRSDQAGNDSLTVANPILAKLLNIPTSALQSSRQHGANLIEQESSSRSTTRTSNHPKAQPLKPLTEVVREEHVMEETVLGHHVQFLHTFNRLVVLFCLLFLAA